MYIVQILASCFLAHPQFAAGGLTLIAIASFWAYRRAEKGVRVTKYLVGFIICILFLVLTTSKLYTMYQLRGQIPGAFTINYKVRQKWDEYAWDRTSRSMQHTYWVSWTDQDIHQPGSHRINVTYDKWSRLKTDDPIGITYVARDPEPYLRNNIFDSDDNFIFDYILLVGELAGAIWLMVKLITT